MTPRFTNFTTLVSLLFYYLSFFTVTKFILSYFWTIRNITKISNNFIL